jgi:hypothetical protein
MPQLKVSVCSALLLLAGLLGVSSCEDSNEQRHCFDCGPCRADSCYPPPTLNGPGGASAFDGAGGLQLNLGSTSESSGGQTSPAGESGGETNEGGQGGASGEGGARS